MANPTASMPSSSIRLVRVVAEALAGVLARKSPPLIYVSCDVATLARDARRIAEAGYRIEQADAFDLFPNTPHVETIILFRNG